MAAASKVSSAPMTIGDDVKGAVVFQGESAGYQNALGMYKIAADGTISDVTIVFANASLAGSGGSLVAGKSEVDVALASGEKIGFFIVPDGYAQPGMAALLNDTSGSFKMVTASGQPGNVNGGQPLKLVHVDANGKAVDIKSAYGTDIFHSVDDGSKGLNSDKISHVVTTVDTTTGAIKIGFEDLKGGGDKDFDDTVFTINVGSNNASLIASGKADAYVAQKAAAEKAAAEKAAEEKHASEKSNSDDDKKDGRGHGDGDHNDDGHDDNGKGGVKAESENASEKSNSDDDKKDGRGHGDGDHNDDGHDDNGRDDDDKRGAAAGAAEHASEKSNSDDDKKDGRGHGDGDHNDDGHADNGKGGEHEEHHGGDDDHDTDPVVDPTPGPVESLVLTAADATEAVTQQTQVGTRAADALVGQTGHDWLFGAGGADNLQAVDQRFALLKLPIGAELVNAADASAYEVTISGVPADASLSAGHDNGDGSWTLKASELKDLLVGTSGASDFALHITASALDGSGLTKSADVTVHVPVAASNLLVGGAAGDHITGSLHGDDYIYGGSIPTGAPSDPNHVPTVADNDVIVTGDGNNHVWGNAGDDQITAGSGNNWLSGGKGDDVIVTGNGNNEVYGNSGDDRLIVGTGNNVVHGGTGFDTLDFSLASGVVVDVKAHTAAVSGGGTTTFDGVEAFAGSHGDDVFVAGKKGEVFTGNGGDDTFVFARGDVVSKGVALAAHEITDFNVGDTVDLRGVFAGYKWQGLEKMVHITDDAKGTHIFAKVGQAMVEVAVLDDFHGHAVDQMVKDGMILV